ncbi:MAG: hypothetical protein MPEBLZ_02886 [Candidatus Methanoperedens nitroreducens]|uniref:Uncharacterized protein n=2 Tax=Candidatus Methanoperedens TaxID=1392997 RepID=A0A0P8AE92_9EURY|nr:MAG: hypothetical protein MPEBLZ_02886 [Candidatus Methanoperedens sp. BLZ1]CAG0986941.1 hypothetical protein METP2_02330 [Methanosarcinales archaeon]
MEIHIKWDKDNKNCTIIRTNTDRYNIEQKLTKKELEDFQKIPGNVVGTVYPKWKPYDDSKVRI